MCNRWNRSPFLSAGIAPGATGWQNVRHGKLLDLVIIPKRCSAHRRRYGWTGQQSGSELLGLVLAPSILHCCWWGLPALGVRFGGLKSAGFGLLLAAGRAPFFLPFPGYFLGGSHQAPRGPTRPHGAAPCGPMHRGFPLGSQVRRAPASSKHKHQDQSVVLPLLKITT
jgi:hypothetical protein